MTTETAGTPKTDKVANTKGRGVNSGLKMLAAWGKYFTELGAQENGRQLVIDAMIADFPEKVESVNRWVDAYRIYFNTGRLPVAKPATPVLWLDEKAKEKAAAKVVKAEEKAKAKADKAAVKEAEKAAKAQAKAEKKAAVEAARAAAATPPVAQ